MSFAGKVWKTLSGVSVSDYTKTKGSMTYLPWSTAWGILMEHYPESEYYTANEPKTRPDGTVMVEVSIMVKEGDQALLRTMWLPVMDHRNNAIPDPDARQVSDTRMRCLTKAIAMVGLGHYIYEGEDMPRAEQEALKATVSEEQAKALLDALEEADGDLTAFLKWLKIKDISEVRASSFDQVMGMIAKKKK